MIPAQTEIWKPVVGHVGYEVSSHGRVRSLPREWQQVGRSGEPHTRRQPGKLLRPGVASNGYPTVALGRGRTRTLHSLVAEAFIGPRPIGMEVCHRDGARTNPAADNLFYGSRSSNNQQIVHDGRRKVSVEQVRWARSRLAAGELGSSVAAALRLSRSQISNIRHGRQYKTVD